MYPGEFETLFRKIANIFTLDTISTKKKLEGKSTLRSQDTPIWDTLDSLSNCDYIDLGNGKYVPCKSFLQKPVRILFYLMLVEFEGRLFRIHEWRGCSLDELNEKNINELIKELVDSDLINLQNEYSSRNEFKEDLKAISSFRNIIMHINKKLEKNTEINLLIKRKKQITRVLPALQQILDNFFEKRKPN